MSSTRSRATRRGFAIALASAIGCRMSAESGRWGPCSSRAPTGKITRGLRRISRANSAEVICSACRGSKGVSPPPQDLGGQIRIGYARRSAAVEILKGAFADPPPTLIYPGCPWPIMAHEPPGTSNGDKMLGHLLRRAREPFASLVEVAGFASAISTTVRSARRIIENSPEVVGPVAVRGVREEGTLWFVGQAAEETRARLGVDARRPSGDARAFIAARVFEVVAYHHPYFDGNKRTAFLASTLVGYYLGLAAKAVSYE